KKADLKWPLNHSQDAVLGRPKSGTCILTDSTAGLHFRFILAKTNSIHRDVYASVQRGDISECSFAFTLQADGSGDEWTQGTDADGRAIPLRTLRSVRLIDVSAVTYPAYGGDATNVSARALPANHKPAPRKK